MPEKSGIETFEVMCFRQSRKGFDVLLRKENTLSSYWHNFFTAHSLEPLTEESATQVFSLKTHLYEKLRLCGNITTSDMNPCQLYFTFLTDANHATLAASPGQIIWVNSDVLLTKLVQRPSKFKPELLEMLTTCLKHLHKEPEAIISKPFFQHPDLAGSSMPQKIDAEHI